MTQKTHHTAGRISIGFIVALTIICSVSALVFTRAQDIRDWFRLRDYVPPAAVASLADNTTMTPLARKLLNVNHPELLSGKAFRATCPLSGEKTVVLGCYKGGDNGIYLYRVTDERLQGVHEVTAAHEMLHAAYERLADKERQRVDKMLQAYARNELHDQRIMGLLEAYKTSEPGQIDNEMHSIFATEIAALPHDLETYYRRYFDDRQRVVDYTMMYQAEFTGRRAKVTAYDEQLKQLGDEIDKLDAIAVSERSSIDRLGKEIESLGQNSSRKTYTDMVAEYNRRATAYNESLQVLRDYRQRYNSIVEERNALALEERDLANALSAQDAPQR